MQIWNASNLDQGLRIKQTKLCSYLNGLEFKIWFKIHAVPSGDAEFSLVEAMSASFRLANKRQGDNKRQVKFLNHLCKTLVDLLKFIDLTKFNSTFIFRNQIIQI